jgi:hypothetical protein
MTSTAVRDPVADHLITPQNAAEIQRPSLSGEIAVAVAEVSRKHGPC